MGSALSLYWSLLVSALFFLCAAPLIPGPGPGLPGGTAAAHRSDVGDALRLGMSWRVVPRYFSRMLRLVVWRCVVSRVVVSCCVGLCLVVWCRMFVSLCCVVACFVFCCVVSGRAVLCRVVSCRVVCCFVAVCCVV